jgi:hypothetical protein
VDLEDEREPLHYFRFPLRRFLLTHLPFRFTWPFLQAFGGAGTTTGGVKGTTTSGSAGGSVSDRLNPATESSVLDTV